MVYKYNMVWGEAGQTLFPEVQAYVTIIGRLQTEL